MKGKFPAVCPYCGGRIVAEFIGSYGDAMFINKNGTVSHRRARRFIYDLDHSTQQVYCWDCHKDPYDYGKENDEEDHEE